LIAALRHPEPRTVRRAIYLLGERRQAEAVSALKALYEDSRDPFVQSDIVRALIRIGNPEAMGLVMRAASHPSFLVRDAALIALRQVPDH
jgi:HEAT repeat protein